MITDNLRKNFERKRLQLQVLIDDWISELNLMLANVQTIIDSLIN